MNPQMVWFQGVVEDRNDPLQLGRVKVRCIDTTLRINKTYLLKTCLGRILSTHHIRWSEWHWNDTPDPLRELGSVFLEMAYLHKTP